MHASITRTGWLWRLRPPYRLQAQSDGGAKLLGAGDWELPVKEPASLTLLASLSEGLAEAELLMRDDAAEALLRLRGLIDRRMVEGILISDARAVAIAEPCRNGFDLPATAALPAAIGLDRFAYLRADVRGLTLEHPEAACRIVLVRPELASFIARMAAGPVIADQIDCPAERALAALLVASGFVAREREPSGRAMWEFHDLLFHRGSRAYGDWRVRGGSYRFRGEVEPPPAFRATHPGATIALPPVTQARARSPLALLMEQRRSVRAFSAQPVALTAISDILYRVGHAQSDIRQSEPGQECYFRPAPSAGGIQAIEIYLAVREGQELAPGFYHYRGADHALTQIRNAESAAGHMLRLCAAAQREPDPPPVLAVLAARLPRLAWKYEGIAYHLALLDAGVLLQSLYLVTADIGLGGCAAGLGENSAFLQAVGGTGFDEVNVAEFAFGHPDPAQS